MRQNAQWFLQAAIIAEIDDSLGRVRCQRSRELRAYRNGHLPPRTVGVGMEVVDIGRPRVRDVPVGTEASRSAIVGRWGRRSRIQGRLLARHFLEGLATGDFEPVFRALVSDTQGLSPTPLPATGSPDEHEHPRGPTQARCRLQSANCAFRQA